MKRLILAAFGTFLCVLIGCSTLRTEPIKALLVTGGCCHDYELQMAALTSGLSQRIAIDWTVDYDENDSTDSQSALFDDPAWAEPYDVVVHNQCYADTADPEYIAKIVAAHEAGVPAVVIHCAMHTFRAAEVDDWRAFLGVTSYGHERLSEYPTVIANPTHPIIGDFPSDWISPMDELYVVEEIWPETDVLITSTSEDDGESHPVVWTNQYGNARVFGTTFGHTNDTLSDPEFQALLARGILWVTNRLG
ncbi:MAG: ThuA domain-containing protein [Leptolyngbyaceae cyanobacterium]